MLTIFFGCENQKDPITNFQSQERDTIIKDVPVWLNQPPFYESHIQQMSKMLNLASLESGTKYFEVRLWVDNNDRDTQQLIILKKDTIDWNAKFYDLRIYYNEQGDIENVEKAIQTKKPKSGWDIFIDSFFSKDILLLRDHSTFLGYSVPNDASIITVEIATPKFYKMYTYPAFDIYKEQFKDPGKLEDAFNLIEKEFDWIRYKRDRSIKSGN